MTALLQSPAFLMALAVSLLGTGSWILISHLRPVSAAERERRRRLRVNRSARTCEGLVMDVSEELVHYRYGLHGVEYDTSQDVSSLRSYLPADADKWIGPVNVKYEPNNPANSIVICEEWSGLNRTGEVKG